MSAGRRRKPKKRECEEQSRKGPKGIAENTHALTPHLRDQMPRLRRRSERIEALVKLFRPSLDISPDILTLEHILHRHTRSTSHRVASVCPAQRTHIQFPHELFCRDDTRKWKAIGDAFREDHDVGSVIGDAIDGEVFASTKEAGLNLIDDKEDAVLVTDISEVMQKCGGTRDVTTVSIPVSAFMYLERKDLPFALNWLDEDGRNFLGVDLLPE